ncbi:FecR domain-containing protein [Pseudomonas sp. ABC1]|uniref:FecR domain-containing protein n=1 Tax=Pseudomonas sp. ABC1 TaxID=2748080 RepID=UPI0015C3501C|nr:FecR domain-containing protein [Pseudomonas sp. ABC1]QLF94422.1 FecR domain-containing protein [Pseudomonas sp. ABC1]
MTSRRRALRCMLWFVGGGTVGFVAGNAVPLGARLADQRTSIGERRSLRLADGSLLQLNTDTAVDIHFEAAERRIELLRGELMLTCAADVPGRPLRIVTRHGSLAPLGACLSVRLHDAHTCVAVSEGVVQVVCARRQREPAVTLQAGQQLRFDAVGAGSVRQLQESTRSWVDGVFHVEGMRLAELVVELGRYRPGILRCAPAVADLRLSGVWRLDDDADGEGVLIAIEQQLPVRIRRFTRYWVSLEPAPLNAT